MARGGGIKASLMYQRKKKKKGYLETEVLRRWGERNSTEFGRTQEKTNNLKGKKFRRSGRLHAREKSWEIKEKGSQEETKLYQTNQETWQRVKHQNRRHTYTI